MKIFVNVLTTLRIISLFLLPIFWNLKPLILVLFVLCVLLTDALDGHLARRYNVVTLFGSLLDMLADKLFSVSILIILARYNKVFIIIAILELLIVIVNVLGSIFGAVTKSSILGKIKMWFLGLMIIVGMITIFESDISFFRPFLDFIRDEKIIIMNILTIILCLITSVVIFDYVYHITKSIIKNRGNKKNKIKSKNELKKVLFDTDYYLKNKDLSLNNHLYKG